MKEHKINYDQIQNESEVNCVQIFIKTYNDFNNTKYEDIIKNPIQNEIDIFCYTKNNTDCLNIQVKKADPVVVSSIGKSIKIPIAIRQATTRSGDQIQSRITSNINLVQEKYIKQGKDMSNIILLLDEMMNPPEFFLNRIKEHIKTSTFKEIWIVCRNGSVFKLY